MSPLQFISKFQKRQAPRQPRCGDQAIFHAEFRDYKAMVIDWGEGIRPMMQVWDDILGGGTLRRMRVWADRVTVLS